jgi:methionine sulfoxide reductase heme-binding subunit
MQWLRANWHHVIVHLAGLIPLALLGVTVAFDLVRNPLRLTMLRSGMIGMVFLVAALACTPISRLLKWPKPIQARRWIGLYGFLYIAVHLGTYAVWENNLDLELLLRDLSERNAMAIGLIAFALLIPLAVTSTNGWQRRLGKRWKQLHRLVYVAVPLAALHFYWLDRDFKETPLVFAVLVALLLALRLPGLRRLSLVGTRRARH